MKLSSCLEKRYRRGEKSPCAAHRDALVQRWGIHPNVAYAVAMWLAWKWGAEMQGPVVWWRAVG